jgi:hypothetical protein
MDTVTGSETIGQDGSTFEADHLYNGKAAKINVVGKLVKKGVKKGMLVFKVKLTKKALKVLKKSKRVTLTLKTILTPAHGKAIVKTKTITLKRRKA